MLPKIALGNVRKSLRDFSVFFITLVFGVCAFYAFASINDQTAVINLTEQQSEAVSAVMRMLSSVSVFVAVILGFLVVYANRFLVRRRKREFGIYLTLGMGRAQVAAIMVMETLAVGVAALVVGLVLGVLLSQIMMYVTANLFEATIPGFAFVFSPGAALSTLACYAAIFALSLLLNVREVSRYRLIDLINADKVSEKVKARSLPVCVVLFLVSLVLMGVAYRTLLENGVMSDKFGQATALVSVGTALFFFSVSGFLLRFLQGRPGVYLRGLNAFTLRHGLGLHHAGLRHALRSHLRRVHGLLGESRHFRCAGEGKPLRRVDQRVPPGPDIRGHGRRRLRPARGKRGGGV